MSSLLNKILAISAAIFFVVFQAFRAGKKSQQAEYGQSINEILTQNAKIQKDNSKLSLDDKFDVLLSKQKNRNRK